MKKSYTMTEKNKKTRSSVLRTGVVVALCLTSVQYLTAQETIVLRNGLNGYEETEDTYLHGAFPSTSLANYGGVTESMVVYGVPWGGGKQPGLIRFGDIAQYIPRNTMITNATLRLCAWKTSKASTSVWVSAFPMLEPWVEGNAVGAEEEGASCFSYRHFHAGAKVAADYWGTNSVVEVGPVQDYDFRHYSTRPNTRIIADEINVPCTTNVWYEFTMTDLVREWVGGTLTNNGVFLHTGDYWSYAYFRPSEYTNELLRPQLVIQVTSITNLAQAAFNCDAMNGMYTIADITRKGHKATFDPTTPTPSLSSDNPFDLSYSKSAVLNGEGPEDSGTYLPAVVANPGTINLTSPAGNDAYTLQCWIKCGETNATSNGSFIRLSGSGADLILNSIPGGGFEMRHYKTALPWAVATSPTGLTGVGEWHHVAAVYGRRNWSGSSSSYKRDTSVQLFVDGVEVAKAPVTTTLTLNNSYTSFYFGGYFKGAIDDMSILPYALYPNELGYHASMPLAKPSAAMLSIR